MKATDFANSAPVLIEIGYDSVKALDASNGFEAPIERAPDGRITESSRQSLIARLSGFLKRNALGSRRQALCAIGARGVSVRLLTLPACPHEETQRLLLLQIESEFPLAPRQLAWGCEMLPSRGGVSQNILVVAVKRETLEDYSAILSQCGLVPGFTVAALARSFLLAQPPQAYSILEVAPNYSELITFQNGVPSSLRVLPCGSRNTDAELRALMPIAAFGPVVYLSGDLIQARLANALDAQIHFEQLHVLEGQGRSAALLGLKRFCEGNLEHAPLLLEASGSASLESPVRSLHLKWAALAAVLSLCALSLRYAEAVVRKPRLERQLSELNAYRAKLPNIDRELSFLQFLQTNQPPYLDRLYVLANAAPPGTRIESLGMSRRGDLSLRVAMQNSPQVTDFRTKLIDSGFFSSVVVEEQTPSPDHQKLNARLTGTWKPSADRKALEAAPPTPKGPGKTPKPVPSEKIAPSTVNSNQAAPTEVKK